MIFKDENPIIDELDDPSRLSQYIIELIDCDNEVNQAKLFNVKWRTRTMVIN